MTDAENVPSRSDLLGQLERLFGSRDPDFDMQADKARTLYREVLEERGKQFADDWFEVYGRPLELCRLAFDQWEELSPRTKREILEEIRAADEIREGAGYLPSTS